ncbi:zeta toxin family protein [Nibrella viscosa]|uniref:Zeta toxin family protein n=2 Tax=Nibrella viscosa TaxID=1084524 RepID=A0ABP8KFE0_9BACT
MIKRMRMFAGPNGSGKSTVKSVIEASMLGYYLNPDDIEKAVKRDGYYDVSGLNLPMSEPEIIDFFENHPLINRSEEADFVPAIRFVQEEFIDFANVGFNSYLSAILTDFLRQKLIEAGRSFTFETVMSSADKVQTLQKARDAGFRNYLYYVATEDPLINISRIRHRVRMGGHNVPDNKVVERYYRSLNLLLDAVRLTNRAYIFDNSGETKVWIAEITDGTDIELKTDLIPHWFTRAVLDKL